MQGAFGAVKMGVHKLSGAVVAIKNFKKADVKNEVEARAIDREIRILKQSVHQHIIKLYEVIDSPTNWYASAAPTTRLGGPHHTPSQPPHTPRQPPPHASAAPTTRLGGPHHTPSQPPHTPPQPPHTPPRIRL